MCHARLSIVTSKISIWKNPPWKYFIAQFRAIPGIFFPRVIERFSYFANLHGTPKIRDMYTVSIAAFFRDVADIPGFAVCNTICNTYSG